MPFVLSCRLLSSSALLLCASCLLAQPLGAKVTTSVEHADYVSLAQRSLRFPVVGAKVGDLQDTYREARSGHAHEALDIIAARGAPVVAVEDGAVAKLFTSKTGGLTVYLFDNDTLYCYYYAHLDRYASDLKEGMRVKRGDLLGYVGSTGNASALTPHLHFAIYKLGPDKKWWNGTPLNPYPLLTGRPIP